MSKSNASVVHNPVLHKQIVSLMPRDKWRW